MIVTVDRLYRVFADVSLADITTKEITDFGFDADGRFYVQFAVNLTAAETERVQRRLSTATDVEETLQARAVDAYQDLLAYEHAASPTNATTVAAVKLLCKVVRALMRIQLRRLDAAD